MIAISSALLLIFMMLIAKGVLYLQAPPLDHARPLDIDEGIPFPEAGQGSSIFSLTALFGAYLALVIVLGWAAAVGLAAGSVLALLYIRVKISTSKSSSFDAHLSLLFNDRPGTGMLVAALLVFTQLFFAASELILLSAIYDDLFDYNSSYSLLFTASVALVGYMYCLNGGYIAVFRTDIVQFIFVAVLFFSLVYAVITQGSMNFSWDRIQGLAPDIWIPANDSSILKILSWLSTMIITIVMAFGFIVASPDTWKRVYLVNRRGRASFWFLMASGILPFFVVFPIIMIVDIGFMDSPSTMSLVIDFARNLDDFLFTLIFLGLLCSFLSSFDSSLINIAHLSQYVGAQGEKTLRAFNRTMAISFACVFLVLVGLTNAAENPYIIANVLVLNFAFISSYMLGTNWGKRQVSPVFVGMLLTAESAVWSVYILNDLIEFTKPTIEQMQAVPFGAMILLANTILIFVFSKTNVRYS